MVDPMNQHIPKVYVVQNQMCRSRDNRSLEPKFDLSSAANYGELVYLLSPSAAPWNPESVIKELTSKLANFNQEDYLLLIGNPALIGMASAIAADHWGRVKFLQWSGKDKGYIPIDADIFPQEKETEEDE